MRKSRSLYTESTRVRMLSSGRRFKSMTSSRLKQVVLINNKVMVKNHFPPNSDPYEIHPETRVLVRKEDYSNG